MVEGTVPASSLARVERICRKITENAFLLIREHPEARSQAMVIAQDATEAANILRRQGVGMDALPPLYPATLAHLDTQESRRLLALLTEAQAVAELVDAQRGNVLSESIPTGAMESRGTDYAESISNLAIRLHMEVVPPQGRD
jgi:hypothetical protein